VSKEAGEDETNSNFIRLVKAYEQKVQDKE